MPAIATAAKPQADVTVEWSRRLAGEQPANNLLRHLINL